MGLYDSDRTSKVMKRQIHDTRNAGKTVSRIVREEEKRNREANKTFREKLISHDGKIRYEIQEIIRTMVEWGKLEEEIIERLNATTSYQAFSSYFQIWIEDYQKRKEEALEKSAYRIIKPMLEEAKPMEKILEELSKNPIYQGKESYFEKWIRTTKDKIKKEYRRNIQPFILRRLQKGATTQEILEDLKKRPEYTEYAAFYSEWIEEIRRTGKNRETKPERQEER